jgi:DNA-binding NtrC family response regulator
MPPDEPLQLLAASLARARGEDFFPVIAEHLGATLRARETAICEAASGGRVRTLAAWRAGAALSNFEYELAGMPCERVYQGERLLIAVDTATFPRATQGYGGYYGLPLTAKDGAVLGHLCAWFDTRIELGAEQRAICDLLANRAAAELRLVHVKRERALLRAQRRQLRAEIAATHDVQDIVGAGDSHQHLLEEISRLAASDESVLVSGEPGTGKELVARAIHAAGARASKPFTRIDCTQILIEAEIAALPQTLGLSVGGTLFLDELGGLAAPMQERLAETLVAFANARVAHVAPDVRLIASTNRDLHTAVRDGVLRADLLRELSATMLELPPLRARTEDIPPLVHRFIQKHARRLGRRVDSVDPDSMVALMRYSWPGNVRELAALVEQAMVTQHGPVLKIAAELIVGTPAERAALIAAAAVDPGSTTIRTALAGAVDFDDTLSTGLHAVQREHILRVLNATHWVIEGNSGAALRLGLKPATLRHRMKKLGITRAQNPQHG